MVVFTGCNKEEEPTVFDDPTVTIEQGASLVLTPSEGPTYDLSLKVTIDAPGKINEIKIQRTKFLGSTIVKEEADSSHKCNFWLNNNLFITNIGFS